MDRLFGIETEYGITIEGVDKIDVVEESMQLIRCYSDADFVPLWDRVITRLLSRGRISRLLVTRTMHRM